MLFTYTFASGSEVRGFDPGRDRWIFSGNKNPEDDFLQKRSKAMGLVIDLRHVEESQSKIRASEQNLSDFSLSL